MDLIRDMVQSTRLSTQTQIRTATIYQVLFTAVPLTLAALHLFLFYPPFKENLYYAVFALSLGLYAFATQRVPATSLGFETLPEQLATALLMFMMVSGLRFSYSLFYERLPRIFFGFLFLGATFAAAGFERWSLFVLLFSLVLFLEILRVHLTAIVKKKMGRGSWAPAS